MNDARPARFSLLEQRLWVLALPAFGLLLVAGLWTTTLLRLAAGERTVLDGALRDTEAAVAAYEHATRRALKDADRTTLLVKHEFERYGKVDLPQLVASGLLERNSIAQVSIADAGGNVVASSLPIGAALNIGDTENFRRYARQDTGQLDISEPVIGPASDRAVILLARRINHRSGAFAGAVLVSVTPDFFTDFYRESDLGQHGFLGVTSLDGTYRGRRIGKEAAMPPSGADAGLAARAAASAAGSYEGTIAADDRARLVAWRKLADYPLVVAAAQARDEVLAEFARGRSNQLQLTALATVVILAFFGAITVLALRLQRQRAEAEAEHRFLQALVDNLPFGVSARTVDSGRQSRYVLWNDANELLLGVKAEQAIGRTVDEVLPPAAAARTAERDRELLASPMVQEVVDAGEIRGRGWRIIRQVSAPIFTGTDRIKYLLSISSDITEEQARADEIRLASKVFETTADAIVLSDADDRVIVVNAAFTKLTGYGADEMVGRRMAESVFKPIDPVEYEARMTLLDRDGVVTGEVPRCRKDGTPLSLWLTATIVRDAGGAIINYVRVFTDISPLKESQRKLLQLASFDTLTGLPNRRLLHDRIDDALRRAGHTGNAVALLFIDLDGFKDVNDSRGHDVGDRLLQEVARRLQGCLRESDSIARFGGDEFAILLEGAAAAEDAVRVAARVVDELSIPVFAGGHRFRTTASVGIAHFPQDGGDATTLLKNADIAMYYAKKEGRNRYAFYSPAAGAPPRPHLRAL